MLSCTPFFIKKIFHKAKKYKIIIVNVPVASHEAFCMVQVTAFSVLNIAVLVFQMFLCQVVFTISEVKEISLTAMSLSGIQPKSPNFMSL